MISKILAVGHRELRRHLTGRVQERHAKRGELGLVPVVQRFGSDLRFNVHVHTLALDGAYVERESGELDFLALHEPSNEEVLEVLTWVVKKMEAVVSRNASAMPWETPDPQAEL